MVCFNSRWPLDLQIATHKLSLPSTTEYPSCASRGTAACDYIAEMNANCLQVSVGFANGLSAHVTGVAQRVAAWLRPDREAVWLGANCNTHHRAISGIDSVYDIVVTP